MMITRHCVKCGITQRSNKQIKRCLSRNQSIHRIQLGYCPKCARHIRYLRGINQRKFVFTCRKMMFLLKQKHMKKYV